MGDGTTTDRNTPVVASGIKNAVDVSLGLGVSCFIFEDSAVRCAGYNNYGQLGIGATGDKRMPVRVWGI